MDTDLHMSLEKWQIHLNNKFTTCMHDKKYQHYYNKDVDIKFSAHDAFLE